MHIIGEEIWLSFIDPFMQCLKVMEIFMLGIQYAKYYYLVNMSLFTNLFIFLKIKTLIMEMLIMIMITSCLWK